MIDLIVLYVYFSEFFLILNINNNEKGAMPKHHTLDLAVVRVFIFPLPPFPLC